MKDNNVSIFNIILETKTKFERSKFLFPNNIPKLKRNFINVTGLSENEWNIICKFPPIRDQRDFDKLLEALS